VVQTGKEGENLGELVVTLDGGKLKVDSYRLHPIDDTIAGDRAIAEEIEQLKKTVTEVVFASRGYSIDQPLAVAPRVYPTRLPTSQPAHSSPTLSRTPSEAPQRRTSASPPTG
jgi:hypothetical protein